MFCIGRSVAIKTATLCFINYLQTSKTQTKYWARWQDNFKSIIVELQTIKTYSTLILLFIKNQISCKLNLYCFLKSKIEHVLSKQF